jgi:hypothetical protein
MLRLDRNSEHRGSQPLSEDVGELRSHRDMKYMNVPDSNALTDKVKIDLNIHGALVLNEVGGEIDDTNVVIVDQSDLRQGVVQLHKQLTKPAHLCHVVGHGIVLRLSARM